jgi:hypothetical protein
MAETADRRGSWAIGIIVLLAVFVLLSRCLGDNSTATVGAVQNSAGPAEPLEAGENAPGVLTVDGEPLLPLSRADGVGPDGDLSALSGKQAVARNAMVLRVPTEEGFWLGIGPDDRVWVQLTGPPPESSDDPEPGDTVSFTARITPNAPGFAHTVGLTKAEDVSTLNSQRQHLDVPKRGLVLNPF